ncbi:hypothetical protein F5148DRAFT_203464 [Russula earlei]|uniref:Uncharacterized protein n=1 Tax=Russula earlei TaxID=71964 RepID=A0ACC0UKU7_9AGAM|nr:hypothetical protein F5148DRAFT_203464 [Russula earlei]
MSDHNPAPLLPEGEDLLQAALSDPFSVPPNLSRVSPSQSPHTSVPSSRPAGAGSSTTSTTTPPEPPTSSSSSSSISVSAAEQDAWRAEYEAHVADWRQQSADVRARAEADRARWAERRERERAEQALRLQKGGAAAGDGGARADMSASVGGESVSAGSEWEAVSRRGASAFASGAVASFPPSVPPAPTDNARHVRGAPSDADAQGSQRSQQTLPRSASTGTPAGQQHQQQQPAATGGGGGGDPTNSPNWENVSSSPTSSFPSMSFPEPSRPHSPEHAQGQPRTTATPAARPAPAASATLAVFDPALPASARFWALLSSLSINMFLPFVNGVMLGFGEIFAKTVFVEWLGWGPAVATNVGLGGRSPKTRR